MSNTTPSRDELAERYLQQLAYTPYRVQEDALLAWFTANEGVLVCAPTGTGKTLIAEAGLFEALHTGRMAYYTTPLIALTEQKFAEMQAAAERWGFSRDDIGLVTGNRRVNPDARVLVVVAEILLNRLLHGEAFDFSAVSSVVMDEFHQFGDAERGIVWELSLGLLPRSVRLLLLSATVGNANEFLAWLQRSHGRKLELVQGNERRVPLTYHWVADELLTEHVTQLAAGREADRRTPALVFCFNRDECWSVAEQLKGCHLLGEPERSQLIAEVNQLDWSEGVGPKLKQLLHRGVGVHHAGVLPRYRRVVEELFQRKLLAVAVCTETLAAGINLPARSVVLGSLVKGPPDNQRLLDSSTAHQIFGRAGRPQFDDRGFVFALAHEDDVRIARWKEKYDAIPENTRDLAQMKAKKSLKKKRPTRRENQVYWNEAQFKKLAAAPPGKLYSKGPIPWRLLAYLLKLSPEVQSVRAFVGKRLIDQPRILAGLRVLDHMLLVLHAGGYVELDPPPPLTDLRPVEPTREQLLARYRNTSENDAESAEPTRARSPDGDADEQTTDGRYQAQFARATSALDRLLVFRSVNPLYGDFLVQQLGIADSTERLQALESVLSMPGPVLRYVRVPRDLPAGPLATTRLDPALIQHGLLLAAPGPGESAAAATDEFEEPDRERPPQFAEKLRLYFDLQYPNVGQLQTQAVWAAGELLAFAGNFNNFIKARDLSKQEGIIFRHLLRLILLGQEFTTLTPPETTGDDWRSFLCDLTERLTETCRAVDRESTNDTIAFAKAADVVAGEAIEPVTNARASPAVVPDSRD